MVMEVLNGQTPLTAFWVNRPILCGCYSQFLTVTTTTQLIWPADVELPKAGMQYVWSVQALDDQGKPIGEKDGWAEPFTFFACCQPDTSGNDDYTKTKTSILNSTDHNTPLKKQIVPGGK